MTDNSDTVIIVDLMLLDFSSPFTNAFIHDEKCIDAPTTAAGPPIRATPTQNFVLSFRSFGDTRTTALKLSIASSCGISCAADATNALSAGVAGPDATV